MQPEKSTSMPQPRLLATELFSSAKKFGLAGAVLALIAALVPPILVFWGASVTWVEPVVLFLVALIAELCLWTCDRVKSKAETMLRYAEYKDSFDWVASGIEFVDILVDISDRLIEKSKSSQVDDYFESKEPPGPCRAVQNLRESAWWSKHLSRTMGNISAWSCITLLLVSVVALVISISTVGSAVRVESISRIILAMIAAFISLGICRFVSGYFSFGKSADRCEATCTSLLNSSELDQLVAVRVLHGYQLARAQAPLIPSWIWKMRRRKLNMLWSSCSSQRNHKNGENDQ